MSRRFFWALLPVELDTYCEVRVRFLTAQQDFEMRRDAAKLAVLMNGFHGFRVKNPPRHGWNARMFLAGYVAPKRVEDNPAEMFRARALATDPKFQEAIEERKNDAFDRAARTLDARQRGAPRDIQIKLMNGEIDQWPTT